jgi:hypothetical protein
MSPSPNRPAYFGHAAILPAAMLWWGRKGGNWTKRTGRKGQDLTPLGSSMPEAISHRILLALP